MGAWMGPAYEPMGTYDREVRRDWRSVNSGASVGFKIAPVRRGFVVLGPRDVLTGRSSVTVRWGGRYCSDLMADALLAFLDGMPSYTETQGWTALVESVAQEMAEAVA